MIAGAARAGHDTGATAANPESTMRAVPTEPPSTDWHLPDPASCGPGEDLVGLGADLEPGTLLAAYRSGLFPMRMAPNGVLAWFSPDPRGIIPIDGLVVHRSLRRSARRYRTTVDRAFEQVMRACGDPSRADGWIDDSFVAAYSELHRLGWAHSVEVWANDGEDDDGAELVGGVYGVGIGRFFAGESMFHRRRDGSKVALVGLFDWMRDRGVVLFDVQWCTPHLASLGAFEVPRARYLALLRDAVAPTD